MTHGPTPVVVHCVASPAIPDRRKPPVRCEHGRTVRACRGNPRWPRQPASGPAPPRGSALAGIQAFDGIGGGNQIAQDGRGSAAEDRHREYAGAGGRRQPGVGIAGFPRRKGARAVCGCPPRTEKTAPPATAGPSATSRPRCAGQRENPLRLRNRLRRFEPCPRQNRKHRQNPPDGPPQRRSVSPCHSAGSTAMAKAPLMEASGWRNSSTPISRLSAQDRAGFPT